MGDCAMSVGIDQGRRPGAIEAGSTSFRRRAIPPSRQALVRRHPSAHDRGVAAVRAVLGTLEFETAVAAGQAMTLEEVVAYALVDDEAGFGPGTEEHACLPTTIPLSPRKRGAAVRISRGCSNREIAAALVITSRTVDTHVMNVFTKLRLPSRPQVAAWAVKHDRLANDT